MKKKWADGSYTIEAALSVPFGFLILMSFSLLFSILLHQNKRQIYLVRAAQSYSATESTVGTAELLLSEHLPLHWEEAAGGKLCSVSETRSIPFLGSGWFHFQCYQQMRANSYRGVSMKPQDEGGSELVYITTSGRVYHEDRNCTYLKPHIQTAVVKELCKKRNDSGGIYYPCEACCGGKAQSEGQQVYITEYGNRYHIRADCPRLKRTIRAVPRSEVGNLPGCSKCAKG